MIRLINSEVAGCTVQKQIGNVTPVELIELRKGHEAFPGGELEILPTETDHVLGFMRSRRAEHAIIFANFSEASQINPTHVLENHSIKEKIPVRGTRTFLSNQKLQTGPLEFVFFIAKYFGLLSHRMQQCHIRWAYCADREPTDQDNLIPRSNDF